MSDENGSAPVAESAPIESADVSSESFDSNEQSSQEFSGEEGSPEIMSDADFPDSLTEEKDFSNVESETQEEFESEVQDAIENGATAEDVKNMVKEFTLKVNGKEIKKKVDLSDEDALIREFQIAEANKGGMAKARELEKLYQQELERLKNDPFSVLQELGHDPLSLAESKINEYIEEQKKSPEQVAFEKMQKELEDARAELQRQKDEAEEAKFKQLQEQESAKLESEIDDALSAHKTLPKTKKTVVRIADALLWAMENGFPNATVQDVLPMVEQDIRDEMNAFMADMPEEMMEQYIGKKNLERLRRDRLKAAKTNNISSIKQTTQATQQASASKKDSNPIKAKDFFKNPLKYS